MSSVPLSDAVSILLLVVAKETFSSIATATGAHCSKVYRTALPTLLAQCNVFPLLTVRQTQCAEKPLMNEQKERRSDSLATSGTGIITTGRDDDGYGYQSPLLGTAVLQELLGCNNGSSRYEADVHYIKQSLYHVLHPFHVKKWNAFFQRRLLKVKGFFVSHFMGTNAPTPCTIDGIRGDDTTCGGDLWLVADGVLEEFYHLCCTSSNSSSSNDHDDASFSGKECQDGVSSLSYSISSCLSLVEETRKRLSVLRKLHNSSNSRGKMKELWQYILNCLTKGVLVVDIPLPKLVSTKIQNSKGQFLLHLPALQTLATAAVLPAPTITYFAPKQKQCYSERGRSTRSHNGLNPFQERSPEARTTVTSEAPPPLPLQQEVKRSTNTSSNSVTSLLSYGWGEPPFTVASSTYSSRWFPSPSSPPPPVVLSPRVVAISVDVPRGSPVGIYVHPLSAVVQHVVPNSPADQVAGRIKPGMRIATVDWFPWPTPEELFEEQQRMAGADCSRSSMKKSTVSEREKSRVLLFDYCDRIHAWMAATVAAMSPGTGSATVTLDLQLFPEDPCSGSSAAAADQDSGNCKYLSLLAGLTLSSNDLERCTVLL